MITICSDDKGNQQAQWSGYDKQTLGVVKDLVFFVNSLKPKKEPKKLDKEQLKLEIDKLLDQLNKFNS